MKVIALVACAVAGCAAPPPRVDRPASVTMRPAPPPIPPPAVRLLDAGTPPREQLRHRAAPGQAEVLVVELETTLALTVGTMSPPEIRSPPVRLTLPLRAGPPDGRGRLTIEGEIARVEVLPAAEVSAAAVSTVAGDLQPLVGTPVGATVTARGFLEALDLSGPSDGTPQLGAILDRLRDVFRVLLPPLPDEPVGKGARWEVRSRAAAGPAAVEESAIYSLTDFAAGRGRLRLSLEHVAAEQTLSVAALPPGVTVTLATLAGTGTGRAELQPASLVQPSERRWSIAATGTSRAAEEPPEPIDFTARGSMALRRGR